MLRHFCLLAASLVGSAWSNPVLHGLQILEHRDAPPRGFVHGGPASPDTMLNLRLALKQNNMDGLIEALYDVSTPSSAKYGQHLSKYEVEEYVSPTSMTIAAVNAWLSENNVTATTISPAGDWLAITLPVSQANSMLDADFSVFTHQESGHQSVRTLSYSIPSDLVSHLDLIHPTVTFTPPSAALPLQVTKYTGTTKKATSAIDPVGNCPDDYVDADCIEILYNMPYTVPALSNNYIAVTGYDNYYANEADLDYFLQWLRYGYPDDLMFTVETLDGGQNDQNEDDSGTEANLDTQYTTGLATYVPVTFLSVGQNNTDGVFGFLDVANYFLDMETPPSVITTSYGSNEEYLSTNVAYALCNAYAQLGARGVSVLYSSGDGGVSGTQNQSCTTFVPSFPSGCPYVTSVGATTDLQPEVAASFSSGGFSNYWATPSFQQSAVSKYLLYLGSTNAGLYNASGRGFPDVSAQGVDIMIAQYQEFYLVDGTSCSSPIFASVVGMLNNQLISAGKSTLGWLNPFLYSTGSSALTDITSGNNPGCGTNGFSATTGWDPVTGLGTPNYTLLYSAIGL
ncbi:hypothetical protein IEO21_05141 [Rhodonia placenta]|uniref:tripeptidyl-peptidase II n=1 Tax=Rhodonia placenta TaxID=104341 RepID=A0A8H7P2Z4_9APHY|nr:hypothetical protein IEO21_05141 [Postia placenta]